MAISEKIRVNALEEQTVPFNNKVDYCIGTGRMGLALQKEYFEQLKLVQEAIGFEYIRHIKYCPICGRKLFDWEE